MRKIIVLVLCLFSYVSVNGLGQFKIGSICYVEGIAISIKFEESDPASSMLHVRPDRYAIQVKIKEVKTIRDYGESCEELRKTGEKYKFNIPAEDYIVIQKGDYITGSFDVNRMTLTDVKVLKANLKQLILGYIDNVVILVLLGLILYFGRKKIKSN